MQRIARGKAAEASLTLEARHSVGKLLISVSDDGAGIDLHGLRAAVVRRGLAAEETAARLSDQELLEFLLLPGFSMRERVTDVSGRSVGLDAVHETVKAVRGTVRIFNEPGQGTRFVLELPLTLSKVAASEDRLILFAKDVLPLAGYGQSRSSDGRLRHSGPLQKLRHCAPPCRLLER
jgi:two-component system sensor histidine kinase and response regulator WspE